MQGMYITCNGGSKHSLPLGCFVLFVVVLFVVVFLLACQRGW